MHLIVCSAFFKVAASNSNNNSTFMEEIQRYECLYDKSYKDHKNRRIRENAWETIGQKFGLTATEAEKKYIRTFGLRIYAT